ncbi:TolC family protein [Fulvivirga maritima]|uniref:TolC family protein n=1 Tax=Fulvivirga maritima TaxID=2904247 RepID=UPI001F40CF44|nr:TolC family protein [Fulvivirga maritima]UII25662.1 TolC family protein [Fulvivirga maritima]
MKNLVLVISVLILVASPSLAQDILESYIDEGISSNLQINALNANYEKSLAALLEIKRKYGPQADVIASYTRNIREGIPFENNEGLAGVIENSNLGNISNGELYLPPQNMYSGGLQVTQPIYIPELKYQKAVYKSQSEAVAANLSDFKTELRATIEEAYYQYLECLTIEKVIKDGLKLAQKNEEAILKLIVVNIETKDALYKAKYNVASIEGQLRDASTAKRNSQYYFNFLLNRPFTDLIEIDNAYILDEKANYRVTRQADSLSSYKLNTIQKQQEAYEAESKLIKSNSLPDIQFKAFGGIQGSQLDFDNERLPMAQLQLSLSWNIFNSGINKAKSYQNYWQLEELKTQYALQKNELEMNERRHYAELQTHTENFSSVTSSYKYAKEYYETVLKKYQLGSASILELTDAQTQLLKADKDRASWFYQLHKEKAQYLKETGNTILILH